MNQLDSIFLIIFENNDYQDVIKQPFFKIFANQGTLLSNSHGVIHPSQPNYFALTAGNTFVTSDDMVTLDVTNLVDLLEMKGISWKVYVENYPYSGYLDYQNVCSVYGPECSYPLWYVRKHNPFISYFNVQSNPQRYNNIIDASQLQADIMYNKVPQFVLYIPNVINDAHNTNIDYANKYLFQTFAPLLRDVKFTRNRIFIITFDESRDPNDVNNHIYTAFWGPNVKSNLVLTQYFNHYNLLRTIEEHFKLGTLGRNDSLHLSITGFLDRKHTDSILYLPTTII